MKWSGHGGIMYMSRPCPQFYICPTQAVLRAALLCTDGTCLRHLNISPGRVSQAFDAADEHKLEATTLTLAEYLPG